MYNLLDEIAFGSESPSAAASSGRAFAGWRGGEVLKEEE